MRTSLMVLCLLLSACMSAQKGLFNSALSPQVALTIPAGEDFQITSKVESVHGYYNHNDREGSDWRYRYNRTDVQVFGGYRINPFLKAAAGYQYRFGNTRNSQRTIQQLALVQRKPSYRLAHRLRTDQTYNDTEAPEYRFRYRLSAEIPLEGLSINPGEYYLILSDEPVFSTQGGETDLENRIGGNLGYSIRDGSKVELGIDYRTDRLLETHVRQRFWITMGWYISL